MGMHGNERDMREANGVHGSTRMADGLALAVLVGSLLLVALYGRVEFQRDQQLRQAHMAEDVTQVLDLLSQRLLAYELSARGGASLFASLERPSAQQWRSYVDGLQVGQGAGAGTLGYAPYLVPESLRELQLEQRAEGKGLFAIEPRGVRAAYGPVLYLEPRTPEHRITLGYDMLSEPVRRAAMERARDEGESRLTGPLRLRRAQDDTPEGALLFTPVYYGGIRPDTVEGRRIALQGWTYVPVRARTFIPQSLAHWPRTLAIRISDVTDDAPRDLYVDADYAGLVAKGHQAMSATQEVYGRQWHVDFVSLRPGLGLWRMGSATVLVGILAALLLSATVWSLARTRLHAERLAMRMSDSYRRSESRFRSAMAHSPIGKALLDDEDRIVDANPALATIVGRPLESLIGQDMALLFADGRDAVEVEDEEAGAHAREGVYRASRVLRRDDGSRRRVRLFSAPVPGEASEEVVRLLQIDDVTDWYRAEERVRALNRTLEMRVAHRTRQLERANHELEAFSYSVSHDLRAPLRAIDGFSRILADRHGAALDDTGRDYLGRIRAATRRMDALIDALLQMARLSRAELSRQSLDLGAIAEQVVVELQQTETGRDVEVAIGEGLEAHGDPALVANLLQNLIGNAWKFSGGRARARIEIGRARRQDGGEAFFVRDNGVGFSQAYASKLFRPFQRLHRQDEYPGHGIGLASVRRIVERHGGEVWAEAQEGEGACFWFTLPEGEDTSAG